MHRNERNIIHRLLKAVHQDREYRQPSSTWHDSIMTEVARLNTGSATTELERLAPRISLTAAIILITAAVAGSWTMASLPGDIQAAYTNQALSVVSLPWVSL